MLNSKMKRELINIIHESNTFDKKSGWFLVNRLWYRHDIRDRLYKILIDFWKQEVVYSDQDVLVCPEGLVSSFGVIPFASLLAHELKYTMVVWKEYGDILTASSLMYPDKSLLTTELRCIVFQDVVSKGTTLQKMRTDLNQLKWKISKYITLIQIEENESEFENNIEDCRKRNSCLTDDFAFVPLLKNIDVR